MSSYFVGSNEDMVDHLMSPDTLMKAAPEYYRDRFEAIKDVRDADDGTGYKGQEFRRVASFVNVPLFLASKLADPEFLKDKRKFYRFIDKYPQYVSYQRRGRAGRADLAKQALPLSALGIDYPGAPESTEGWDAVEVPLDPASDTAGGPTTESSEVSQ